MDTKTGYEYETLLVEFSDGVCVLTLNRPEKRNAMGTVVFIRLVL